MFKLFINGLSNRAIARFLHVSEHCVRIRLRRLANRAFVFQAEHLKTLKISEPICYDGLENFSGSQYDPNNIGQAIGRDSLFIYDFNYVGLNRKGRMSPWQKNRLNEIEFELGRYNPRAIRLATKEMIRRLYEKRLDTNGDLTFLSDEHFQYRRVVSEDLKELRIEHVTVSSKACRNFQNILFPVNHADLMIRHQIKAFTRETIAFSKNAAAMCQKYALYMVFKNFMAPQFTKKLILRPFAHRKSPAQALGICEAVLSFRDVFGSRSTDREKNNLNREWEYYFQGKIPPEYQRNLSFCK